MDDTEPCPKPDLVVTIKLKDCKCRYTTNNDYIVHDIGPYSNTCPHRGVGCDENALFEQVKKEYTKEIEEARIKLQKVLDSQECIDYNNMIENAIRNGVETLELEDFGKYPLTVKNIYERGYNIGQHGATWKWYLVTPNEKWDTYPCQLWG